MSLKRSEVLSLYFELEKNTEKFIQAIQEKGFRLIAVGSYKSVYSKNKSSYVIKVATSLNDGSIKGRPVIFDFAEMPC